MDTAIGLRATMYLSVLVFCLTLIYILMAFKQADPDYPVPKTI